MVTGITTGLSDRQRNEIELAVRSILEVFDDADRPGLLDTPRRVCDMLCEMLAGNFLTNESIAGMFDVKFAEPNVKDMVVMKDIDAFSLCEHHLALMYNMKVHVAYIPKGYVIGLSKIARIVDMVSRRLQLQERIAADIADIMEMVTKSDDVMVVVEGEHGCMTARGIRKPGTSTSSAVVRGLFKESPTTRQEAYALMGK